MNPLSDVLLYKKPTTRPEPVLIPHPTPDEIWLSTPDTEIAASQELAYLLVRTDLVTKDDHATRRKIPSWSVFHALLTDNVYQTPSTVAFNPIIMAAPTDYNTIYTTHKRA